MNYPKPKVGDQFFRVGVNEVSSPYTVKKVGRKYFYLLLNNGSSSGQEVQVVIGTRKADADSQRHQYYGSEAAAQAFVVENKLRERFRRFISSQNVFGRNPNLTSEAVQKILDIVEEDTQPKESKKEKAAEKPKEKGYTLSHWSKISVARWEAILIIAPGEAKNTVVLYQNRGIWYLYLRGKTINLSGGDQIALVSAKKKANDHIDRNYNVGIFKL